MKIKSIINVAIISLVIIGTTSCNNENSDNEKNPFFFEYDTPFNVPPFDLIKTEHFMPAFESGMKVHTENIEKIIKNQEAPSFSNTIEALENSSSLLIRVKTVFSNLSSANTNKEIDEINKEISPILSAHNDNIYMNFDLFKKIKSVYDNKDNFELNEEQEKLLTNTYKSFIRNGVNLSEEKKSRLKEINSELSSLSVNFSQNLLEENNRFKLVIENEADLSGLPESSIEAAAKLAKENDLEGKWIFTLHNPSAIPFLQYADNRELRKQMYLGYTEKCNYNDDFDNKQIASKIASLRVEKAQILGYKNHASYILEETMAKTPENAYNLLYQLWTPALAVAKKEASQIQELMNKTAAGEKLEPWDWRYYAEKVRKEKYNLDAQAVRPYFKLENVRDGIFTLCDKLYGLKFVENRNVPRYHPDVKAYEVKDNDGSHLGLIYLDYFTRSSKRSGAWMTSYRKTYQENGKRIAPIISVVFNFSASSNPETPVLLTSDEVETFFHEFGHGLHGLFGNTEYYSLSGTSTPRDFVEFPSQVLENWAFEPEMLALYAKHYETGEIIPDEIIKKMEDASKFNQGFASVEYIAASILDLAYHTLEDKTQVKAANFETKKMKELGLIKEIAPRYRTTYFQHVFAGGYSSSYYCYIWSEVLDSDAFQAFKETGDIFNKELAESFRKNILEKGGTQDPMQMYVNYRGREPETKFLIERRGLN